MLEDIVVRLRAAAAGTLMQIAKEKGRPMSADLIEAADEIERLRSLLREWCAALDAADCAESFLDLVYEKSSDDLVSRSNAAIGRALGDF